MEQRNAKKTGRQEAMNRVRPGWQWIRATRLLLAFVLLIGCQKTGGGELPARLQSHVRYLASDELEGRASGTPGAHAAALYIEKELRKAGALPVGESFLQPFQIVTDVVLENQNEVTVWLPGAPAPVHWQAEKDFVPLAFSPDSTVEGPVVFAGYGLTGGAGEYDDYRGRSVKGKIVLVFRGTPDWADPHSSFSAKTSLRYKAAAAREAGALAIVFVSPDSEEAGLSRLKPDNTGSDAGIVAIQATRQAVAGLLPDGKDLQHLVDQINQTRKPVHLALGAVRMRIRTDLKRIYSPTENVTAVIPGTDSRLKNQYVLIGAHYDHLGWGGGSNSRYEGKEPAIHHGADDNASGTASLIELARYFARNPQRRSILLVAFTGEELGLLGSSQWVKHPPVPLDSIVTMINLDMVGRLKDDKLNVQGVGTSSLWEPLLDSLAERHGFQLAKSKDGYGPSDHASFYAKHIPVLFFFTGLHEDYHRPSDTWDKINYAGMARILALVEEVVSTVASRPERPDFVKVKSASPGRAAAFRVYLGTIPDYSDNPHGLRISGVREGSPAEKAGLRADDIIVAFGGKQIKNIYDFTYALSACNPGDSVAVVVLRGKNKVYLTVVPARRKAAGR
ncbi:MAG: M28 family peptidase [Calditrichaeota bacterium]|nr:MAG: M28 family peptidase [Calditrichota bacterium]